ncbi:DUF2254 domain-containing protein [Sphingomonas sp. CROZ-RG-20F-R02-07]|uniref:DUF2254 domain-containing protein n=1 Tax=Sphingomonas sp. CROZ-RG-20F-R02-07 TaxID=2914832 RepID=UPI001F59EBBF|nr:DUF2254 domain-containing protein [Sphingomonas sp. CROZ-RG-20F-R02-07]
MTIGLKRFAEKLGASYWFVPTVMAFLAVLLAGGMIVLDTNEGSQWMDSVPWLYAARPSGARSLLSSIGGSMITVAGTVFSVTIAAVVYASGQYGPRLLTNFMKDRGNQFTLGTFIATYLYCLLILRTIRSAEENGGYSFVPNLSLLVAVVLAVCSIGVLIFFIHHVPSKIHINSVIEDIGARLLREIGHRFPRHVGSARPDDDLSDEQRVPATFRRDCTRQEAESRRLIDSRSTGYIQTVDNDDILQIARDRDLVLRMQYQPGDFVHIGRTMIEAWPAERCDDDTVDALRDAFATGQSRSTLQDLRFPIDELVEIAARAMSPGVNDPFTALTCLDWLSAALSDLVARDLPSHLRVDEDGALRVIAHSQTFATFLDRSFGALIQYCAADMIAALRFLTALGEVSLDCDDPGRLAAITAYVDRLEALATKYLDAYNLAQVSRRSAQLRHALAEPDYKRRLRDGTAWLGGTA